MKKRCLFVIPLILFCSSLSATTLEKAPEIVEAELFCEAGFDAVEFYYDLGGDDGFFAGALFDYVCSL